MYSFFWTFLKTGFKPKTERMDLRVCHSKVAAARYTRPVIKTTFISDGNIPFLRHTWNSLYPRLPLGVSIAIRGQDFMGIYSGAVMEWESELGSNQCTNSRETMRPAARFSFYPQWVQVCHDKSTWTSKTVLVRGWRDEGVDTFLDFFLSVCHFYTFLPQRRPRTARKLSTAEKFVISICIGE